MVLVDIMEISTPVPISMDKGTESRFNSTEFGGLDFDSYPMQHRYKSLNSPKVHGYSLPCLS
jgi:hypothetical protein